MATQAAENESFIDITITTFSSPEPESQRGRKRGRSPPGGALAVTATRIPSAESATFRGRCRHRSTSRIDTSRATSRLRGGSLSPTRRRVIRVVQLNRHRSQSPSRSRSPNGQESSKRRRQRTQSRSRNHEGDSTKSLGEPIITSFLRHEIVIRNDGPSQNSKQDG
ncbi:uncharacterized protein GGS25DRAFT_523029 [Hypoxylon fragiforme]|uniref:uncharacterized protein n=1 Tax=Hypoxylon fragiforme TaxID=63214 RepID=UPI0020C736AF|nr:uncharacterized protein GGS25DRAFT_523029 [Hypoxylon fragiforme]KAI2607509.1 hypothetical protein GGS25DRAFT_523029 [Hypoxylon fragiforme]